VSASTISGLDWAWEQQLPSTPKFVLRALADHAWSKADHTCWPSLDRLTRMCGLSKRAVQDALRDLLASKFIRFLGIHKIYGTPIYQLAVGECVKWLGRLRQQRKLKRVAQPPLLFEEPGSEKPVNQVPPNKPEFFNSELKQERESGPPNSEHITQGGLTFTVAEWRDLERRLGPERLRAAIAGMVAYKESGRRIFSPYRAALVWKESPPQQVSTKVDKHERRVQMRIDQAEDLEIFEHCLCRHCDHPHQWKTPEAYADFAMRERACPELRAGLKCAEIVE